RAHLAAQDAQQAARDGDAGRAAAARRPGPGGPPGGAEGGAGEVVGVADGQADPAAAGGGDGRAGERAGGEVGGGGLEPDLRRGERPGGGGHLVAGRVPGPAHRRRVGGVHLQGGRRGQGGHVGTRVVGHRRRHRVVGRVL